jgi:hypothetical protein
MPSPNTNVAPTGGWPILSDMNSFEDAPSLSRFVRQGGDFDFFSSACLREIHVGAETPASAAASPRKGVRTPALPPKTREGQGTQGISIPEGPGQPPALRVIA